MSKLIQVQNVPAGTAFTHDGRTLVKVSHSGDEHLSYAVDPNTWKLFSADSDTKVKRAKQPTKILAWMKERFNTLSRAFENRDTGLMCCTRIRDRAAVVLICAFTQQPDGSMQSTPFAELITADNPFEAYEPPK